MSDEELQKQLDGIRTKVEVLGYEICWCFIFTVIMIVLIASNK